MKKLLKTLSFILVIIMLFSAVACNNTVDPNTPNNGDDSGNTNNGDGSGDTNNGDDSGNNENVTPPDMQIPEGYTVLSSKDLTLQITYKDNPPAHKARIAALKNEAGEQALYLDVISKDNEIILTKVFQGFYQLFVCDEDRTFSIVQLSIKSTDGGDRATIMCGRHEISDQVISSTGISTNETPKFQSMTSYGAIYRTASFYFASPSDRDYARNYVEMVSRDISNEFKQIASKYYMLADNFSDPSSPKLYTQDDKVPVPDITQAPIRFKYEFDSIFNMCREFKGLPPL